MSATIDEMSAPRTHPPLRRDTARGVAGGVIAGVAERTGIDLVLLRVGFVSLAVVTGGLALLPYLVAWAALPGTEDSRRTMRIRSWGMPRVASNWRLGAGLGLLTLSALLAFRELGIWWSDAIAWPLVLAAFGAAILWRRSPASRPAPGAAPAWAAADQPVAVGAKDEGAPGPPTARSRFAELYGGVFGILLVLGAALLFLASNDLLGGVRDIAVTTVVVVVALALVLAPFLWQLGRNLASERAERIRSQERARVGAHLHDSVLQTLALMQKRADDPREVAALARRQEHELRDWLSAEDAPGETSLSTMLRSIAGQIEDDHRVAIEVVAVGDCELDERAEAVLGAMREALSNAAKHAGEAGPIRAYAEVDEERIEAFVRDAGTGFELAEVPPDRRGVRESIIGRMKRAGGQAELRSVPEGGTEVAVSIERERAGEGGRR